MHEIQYESSLGLWLTSYDTPRCSLISHFPALSLGSKQCPIVWLARSIQYRFLGHSQVLDRHEGRDVSWIYDDVEGCLRGRTHFKPVAKGAGIHPQMPSLALRLEWHFWRRDRSVESQSKACLRLGVVSSCCQMQRVEVFSRRFSSS